MHFFQMIMVSALVAAGLFTVKPALATERAPQGQAANRWRYQFYSGRWWYWKPDAQWSYYDGRRWVDWGRNPSDAQSIAGTADPSGSRRTLGYRAFGVYPFNYGGTNTATEGTVSPMPAASGLGATRSGFGAGTIAGGSVGVGLETGSRSGDISSGVGGGSVGGADVSGWNQRK